MKLSNLSQHPLAMAFISRGRQWLSKAAVYRRKTEVLPPPVSGPAYNNPCAGPTLAMYAKAKRSSMDSVTILDTGERLECQATGDDSVAGTARATVEVDGVEYGVIITKYSDLSLLAKVYLGGELSKSVYVYFHNDLPRVLDPSSTLYGLVVDSVNTGVAYSVMERYTAGVAMSYRTTGYWVDLQAVAAAVATATASVTVQLGSILPDPVIDISISGDNMGYSPTLWVANGVLHLNVNYGNELYPWPVGISYTDTSHAITSDSGLLYADTSKVLYAVQYRCIDNSIMLESAQKVIGPWTGTEYYATEYSNDTVFWHTVIVGGVKVDEYAWGHQLFFTGSGQEVEFSYPVYRGDTTPNLVANYELGGAKSITIDGSTYTYDVLPAGDSVNEPMYFSSTYDRFYAGKVLAGDVLTDALVCINVPYTTLNRGYVASGGVLVTTPVIISPDRVCGMHGKITLLETGELEFKLPYRVVRIVQVT